jgi:hypothetical protein
VRGHQQCAGQGLEEPLEPDDRLDIEVVGRFVHQQDVRPAEQHPRHGDAHLPAAREEADIALDAIVLEAQPVQHLARLRLEAITAGVLVLLLDLAEARQDAIHVAGAIGVAHRLLQRLELVMQIAQTAAAGNRLVQDRAAGHLLDVLAEVADRQLLRHRDIALVRRFLADDHPEQRRLAGAVRADQTDFLAGVELERGVDEQNLPAVLLADA